MWSPAPITPPARYKTKEANFLATPTTLAEESERLIPDRSSPVEISDLGEYYEHLKAQNIDPGQWGLFKTPRYNFAVRKPIDFILQKSPNQAVKDSMPGGVVMIGGLQEEDDDEVLLMNAASATMTEPGEAIEIDGTILVPGIVSSYTDVGIVDGKGYSGFKAWIKVEEGKEPEDTFFLPDISSHSGTPDGEMSRLKKNAPELGALSTRQLLAVTSWLSEVPVENRIN